MAEQPVPLAPIVLQASIHETIWGGQNLAQVAGKALPPGRSVGETWETALDAVAVNVPYVGQSLGELVQRHGERLIGTAARAVYGLRFPLLVKFIDAQQQLSVQVHPDDAYAAAHAHGKLGKTEAWYILRAAPGATLVFGLRQAAARDALRRAIARSEFESLLHVLAVHAGDVVFVPPGTVHAIGAGVVLFEVQEYSDVTFRLYDYGRLQADGTPRALHVEHALAVMRHTPAAAAPARPLTLLDAHGAMRRVLVACHYFIEEEILLDGELDLPPQPSSCQVLTVLAGTCTLAAATTVTLGRGSTAVLPAAAGIATIRGAHAQLIRVYVPTADDALVPTWQAAQPCAAG